MQFRARSLRTALFATALMTAVAAPAAAAPATRTAPATTADTVAEVKPIAVLPSSSYGLGFSSATATGTASGRFLSWNNAEVVNRGRAVDRGPGVTRVTFKHYLRINGRLGSTRTFIVDNGVISTNYSVPGNFMAIVITTCKTGLPCREMIRIRT
jgi:hypothetical protein